jgi:hypothetical protein
VRLPGERRSRWSRGLLVVAGLASFGLSAYATNYSSLSIPQNGTVQIGSPSENLFLAMQGDGNLVLYQNGTALWNTGTEGQNCGTNQCFAVFQSDGNFVVYKGSTALWNSQTGGNSGATLVLTDQLPHLEIISTNGSVLWANAFTFSAGNLDLPQGAWVNLGSTVLMMQNVGNLVMYQSGNPVWYTSNVSQSCANQCQAVFQGDGNLVVYNGSTVLWNSGTWGNPWAQLVLSSTAPYVQVIGMLTPAHPAKEYIYLNGKAVAIENNPQ